MYKFKSNVGFIFLNTTKDDDVVVDDDDITLYLQKLKINFFA